MSDSFLLLHGRLDGVEEVDFERWLPTQVDDSMAWRAPGGSTLLRAWSCAAALSRGGWWATTAREAVAYDGWFTESEGVPLSESVAEGLLSTLQHASLPQLVDGQLDGCFSAVHVREDGDADVVQDVLGAAHVYYGERDGLIAVSNRSVLVALALYRGQLPAPSHASLGWLLTNLGAPFRGVSLWDEITCLPLEARLSLRAGVLTQHDEPQDAHAQRRSWDEHYEALCRRAAQIKRLPDASCRMGLTGGKDSRLVLAGLIGAGALERVDHAYLRALPEHPDVKVARQLAERYGLRFELLAPPSLSDEPLLERLDRHLFLTEGLVNAWDLKAERSREPQINLHGNFGEVFRGKLKPYFALGWPVVWAKYTHAKFLNPFGLLKPHLVAQYRGRYVEWMRQQRAHRISALQVNERLHREVRMHRWVGDTMQADSLICLGANIIPGRALYQHYLSLPPHERKGERVHFELTRRADDWLWRQPFANDQWKPWITRERPDPIPGSAYALSSQLQIWRREGAALRDWMLSPGCPALHELLEPQAVQRFVSGLDLQDPPNLHLKTMFILMGIRRLLERGITPHPMSVSTG